MKIILAALVAAAVGAQLGPPPAPLQVAALRGRVLRADGRPLARATVRLVRIDGAPGGGVMTSDEGGRFDWPAVAPGPYMLFASKPGYVTTAFGGRRAGVRSGGRVLVLTVGDAAIDADIVLPRASAIVGHVADEFGDPVEGAVVRVSQIGYSQGGRQLVDVPDVASRRTNDLGAFRLFGLEPGQYVVSAAAGEVAPFGRFADMPGYGRTYYPGTSNPSEAQFVTVVAGGDVSGIDFALARVATATVSGTALNAAGDPVLGGLTLAPSRRANIVAGSTAGARISNGAFEFPNVAPGEYIVRVQQGRRNESTESEFVSQFVTVNGADVIGLTLRAPPGSRIAGHFVFDDTAPPVSAGADLAPMPVDPDVAPLGRSAIAHAAVHDDWAFEMDGICGPRRLRLLRPPSGWALKGIFRKGVDITDAVLTFGRKDQSLDDVEVALTSRATAVSGTVVDLQGAAAPAAEVVVFAADPTLWYATSRFIAHAATRAAGAFTVTGLPPGDYLAVAVDRLEGGEEDGEWQDSALLGALAARATRVSLGEGTTATVSLRLVPHP